MAVRNRIGIEEEKNIYAKEWGVKSKNNLVTSWYTDSRTWREVEEDGASNKKLLMARND